MTTGQRIQQARKKAGLSQKQLGEKLGLSASMIGQWENDLRNPKRETLERIADALNVSVAYFLGYAPTHEIAKKDFFEGKIDAAIHNVLEVMFGKKTETKIAGDGNYLIETISIYGSGEDAISINDDDVFTITEAVKGIIRVLVEQLGGKPEEVLRQCKDFFSSEQYKGLCADMDKRSQGQAQQPPQSPPSSPEGTDTTTPQDAPEGAEEGE